MSARKPKKRELNEATLALIAERLAAMGDPMRLRILNLLCCRGELNVTELVELSGGRQANVSRHLGKLSSVGLVSRRKLGNQVFYALTDDSLPGICDCLCRSMQNVLRSRADALAGE